MTGATLHAGRLWPMPGDSELVADVALGIADGRISAIEPAAQTAESRRLLALPALINAHDHGYGLRPMAFGCPDDALEPWIAGLRARPRVAPYVEAAVAFGRMARAGIGTTVHCHNSHNADQLVEEAAEVARAARDVGIRVAFSCPIADRNPWVYGGVEAIKGDYSAAEWAVVRDWQPNYAPAAAQLARVDAVAEAHHSETFNVQYGPVGPQWCQDDTLAMIAEASARTGRRVHMHLLETRRQRAWTDAQYANGIVGHLDDIGLLSSRLTVAHGVWLTPDECALLATRGVTVATNTASNLRLRSGLAPLAEMHGCGTRFAIGLDGSAFDDDQDALRDLRLTRLVHGGTALRPALPDDAFLRAAFGNGGVAFDGDDAGRRLAVGNPADVLCLDYGAMAGDIVGDSVDVATVLLTRAAMKHVRSLTVAGRRVVANGEPIGVDLGALEDELKAQAARGAEDLVAALPDIEMHRERVRAFYERREEG